MPNDARIEELVKEVVRAAYGTGYWYEANAAIEEILRTAIREAREEQTQTDAAIGVALRKKRTPWIVDDVLNARNNGVNLYRRKILAQIKPAVSDQLPTKKD